MVDKIRRGKKTYHICDVCGMAYEEEKWARQCESFCRRERG